MSDPYESWIERQIREAQERGEFDHLPGAGQPLPDHNELYDEDWWIKGLIRREGLRVLPTTLALRRDIEELPLVVATKITESAVRQTVARLNERILRARRGPVDGPSMVFKTVDVEDVVRAWRERRGDRAS
jgi:DnaJ-like protein